MKGLKFDDVVEMLEKNLDDLKKINEESPLPKYMKK